MDFEWDVSKAAASLKSMVSVLKKPRPFLTTKLIQKVRDEKLSLDIPETIACCSFLLLSVLMLSALSVPV
jgi:hypothetical protein